MQLTQCRLDVVPSREVEAGGARARAGRRVVQLGKHRNDCGNVGGVVLAEAARASVDEREDRNRVARPDADAGLAAM